MLILRVLQMNIPAMLWTASYNGMFVLAYTIALDIVFFPRPKAMKKTPQLPKVSEKEDALHPHPKPSEGSPPKLLDAVNNHRLATFLIVRTLELGSWERMLMCCV